MCWEQTAIVPMRAHCAICVNPAWQHLAGQAHDGPTDSPHESTSPCACQAGPAGRVSGTRCPQGAAEAKRQLWVAQHQPLHRPEQLWRPASWRLRGGVLRGGGSPGRPGGTGPGEGIGCEVDDPPPHRALVSLALCCWRVGVCPCGRRRAGIREGWPRRSGLL